MASKDKRVPALCDMVLVPIEALAPVGNNGASEAAAVITRVWSDDMINVRVLLDGTERVLSKTSVALHADRAAWEEARDAGSPYGCYWAAEAGGRARGSRSAGGAQ